MAQLEKCCRWSGTVCHKNSGKKYVDSCDNMHTVRTWSDVERLTFLSVNQLFVRSGHRRIGDTSSDDT